MRIENISIAVLSYFEHHLMPQIPSSLGKAMAYGGLLLTMPKLEDAVRKNAPMLTNENGDIDLDKLNSLGLSIFEKIPKIEIGDFDFDRNDFENFIAYLSTQA